MLVLMDSLSIAMTLEPEHQAIGVDSFLKKTGFIFWKWHLPGGFKNTHLEKLSSKEAGGPKGCLK